MARDKDWAVLNEHVSDKVILKHSVAVEIAMRAYADKFGEDVEYWGSVGLLHDVDFEKFPHEHPKHAGELLLPNGYCEQLIRDIQSHARDWSCERSLVQKALYAVDELTGFVIACALVRPDKSMENLETRSVMKKMKDKAFARAVNRDTLMEGAKLLDVPLEEHIGIVREALARNYRKIQGIG